MRAAARINLQDPPASSPRRSLSLAFNRDADLVCCCLTFSPPCAHACVLLCSWYYIVLVPSSQSARRWKNPDDMDLEEVSGGSGVTPQAQTRFYLKSVNLNGLVLSL